MALALAEAAKAAAAGEVPIGAVVVRDGAILAVAHNAPRALHDPTAHAEMLAIRAAAATLGSERLDGCELWVTLEPCAMCAGAIALARMDALRFAAEDPKGGGVVHGARVFSQPTCHHRPDVLGGIGDDEAAAQLKSFFMSRRDRPPDDRERI
jgi:tRNA(Arg) A34 adenosine deaminase TadA